jgi:hypothetical protein
MVVPKGAAKLLAANTEISMQVTGQDVVNVSIANIEAALHEKVKAKVQEIKKTDEEMKSLNTRLLKRKEVVEARRLLKRVAATLGLKDGVLEVSLDSITIDEKDGTKKVTVDGGLSITVDQSWRNEIEANFSLPVPKEDAETVVALREKMDKLNEELVMLQAKYSEIPRLERMYKAQLTNAQLAGMEGGSELVKMVTSRLEKDLDL